jgi:hypothetical protein
MDWTVLISSALISSCIAKSITGGNLPDIARFADTGYVWGEGAAMTVVGAAEGGALTNGLPGGGNWWYAHRKDYWMT